MTFNPKSFAGIELTARGLAMAGASAEEISKALDLHITASQRIVNECLKHKAEFQAAVDAGG